MKCDYYAPLKIGDEIDRERRRFKFELVKSIFVLASCAIVIAIYLVLIIGYNDAVNAEYPESIEHEYIYDREMKYAYSYLTKEQREAIEEGRFDDL